MYKQYKHYSKEDIANSQARVLANEANAAFDRRYEAAANLAAITDDRLKDPEYWQKRKPELREEMRTADQEFQDYELASSVLMPPRDIPKPEQTPQNPGQIK